MSPAPSLSVRSRSAVALAALGTALVTGLGLVLATPTAGAAGAAQAPATRVTVVRPVTTAGSPAPGWTVRRQRDGAASCSGPSASAVDDGIAACSPSALYLPSCWRSRHHTVLCVRDVTSHRLVRVHYRGAFSAGSAPDRPSPQALTIPGGASCTIRVGGAWGTVPSHPRWVGFYSCTTGSVYGPPRGDGIDRSHRAWRVHLVDPDGTVHTRPVRRAFLVGSVAA